MSALNHTAPRFRSHGSSQLAAGGGSGSGVQFTQALDIPPRLAATSLGAPTPATMASPAPPHLSSAQPQRNSARYSGVDHTLGPVFSEEEDGDDSDFIAAKMAALGIDAQRGGRGSQYNSAAELQRRIRTQQMMQLQILAQQQQQQVQQQQQAAALQNLLLQSNDPQQLREAMTLLELQRAQLAAGATNNNMERMYAQQQQQQQEPSLARQRMLVQQQQALALQQLHQQQQQQQQHQLAPAAPLSQAPRHNLAAQLEAGTLRRERERDREQRNSRSLSPDSLGYSRLRAAFESAGGTSGYLSPLSPPVDSAAGVGWTSTLKSPASEWPTSAWTVTSVPQRSSSSGSNSTSARAASPVPAVSTPPAAAPAFPQIAPTQQPLGRFARARQDIAAAQAASPGTAPLTALLSRRRPVEDDTASSSSSFPETVATSPLSESYHGRPGQERTWSTESVRKVASESSHTMIKDPASYVEWGYRLPAPRSQSFSAARTPEERTVSYIMRQPYGPPGSPDSLKKKNFATSIRRQAGLNLGMLNRRTGNEIPEA